jgi:hypothetical protein
MKAFDIQVHKKKLSLRRLSRMPVETPLFVRDRCRYARERRRSLKISCEFKKQCRKMKSVELDSK